MARRNASASVTEHVSGIKARIQQVQLADLNIDESYQRGDENHQKHIENCFDPEAVGVLKVGKRPDASLWIIDGRQRRAVLLKKGIAEWTAEVIQSSGSVFESRIFGKINGSKGHRSINAWDTYRSARTAGDEIVKVVDDAVALAGFTIILSKKLDDTDDAQADSLKVNCVGGFRRVAERAKGDGQYITRALNIIKRSWPGRPAGVRERIPVGLAFLLCRPDTVDVVDDDRLVQIMQPWEPRDIIEEARKMPGHMYEIIGFTIAKRYNKGMPVGSCIALKGLKRKDKDKKVRRKQA